MSMLSLTFSIGSFKTKKNPVYTRLAHLCENTFDCRYYDRSANIVYKIVAVATIRTQTQVPTRQEKYHMMTLLTETILDFLGLDQ